MLFPIPDDPAERERVEQTRLVRRILYGGWRQDLVYRVRKQIGSVKQEAWGEVDMSANLTRAVWDSLARLFDSPPIVMPDQPDSPVAAEFLERVEDSGFWARQQRFSRDVLGMRECAYRIDYVDDEPVHRVVYPDMLSVKATADRPYDPFEIRELREREVNGKPVWAYDVCTVADPDNPTWRVVSADGKHDWSNELIVGGARTGDAYPYRYSDGTPFLPYEIYHAADTGQPWDVGHVAELTEATLQVGVLFTFLQHVIRSASWPQRYTIDLEVLGAEYRDENGDGVGRNQIITDPATVLMMRSIEGGNPSASQWATAADVAAIASAVGAYERRASMFAGISASPEQQKMSGDPRSGYAIHVSRDAQREAQRRFEPMFRRSDQSLLGKTAAIINRASGTAYPETGWRVNYAGVPQSTEERESQRRHVLELVTAGLLDPVEAYRTLNPGTSYANAELALTKIAEQRRRFGAA